jgi:hypothetical protein
METGGNATNKATKHVPKYHSWSSAVGKAFFNRQQIVDDETKETKN